jgi:DNA-binding CsgD family transcriptional regulator
MEKPSQKLSPEIAALLREADRHLHSLEPENPYSLYEYLYSTAACIAPVDACYVCLYSEADRLLYFPYNVEGAVYEEPVILPLGNGPTSQVIRTGQMQLWNDETAPLAGRVQFGPMRVQGGTARRPGPVLGVLSTHSYVAHAYGTLEILALQSLADLAADALRREWDAAAWHHHLRVAETKPDPAGRTAVPGPQVAMAEEMIALLLGLTRHVEALRDDPPTDPTALHTALDALCRDCYRIQTHASQLPLRPGLSAPPIDPRLTSLSPTEMVILRLIHAGQKIPEIAETRSCSKNTVKYHWLSIQKKLGITRHEATRLILPPPP